MHHRSLLGSTHQIDIADAHLCIVDNAAENPYETIEHRLRRRLVEKISSVGQFDPERGIATAVGTFGDGEMQVGLGDVRFELDGPDSQIRELQVRVRDVLEREADLEQRTVRRGSRRIDRFDNPLEGNVGVRECSEVHFADVR